MIPLIDASFLYNFKIQTFNLSNLKELVYDMGIITQLGIVFTINSQEDLNDKNYIGNMKKYFEQIEEKCKNVNNSKDRENDEIKFYFIIQIQIEMFEFRDIQITQIKTLKHQCDMLMVHSYSNMMLEQIISKKAAHMIVNVFSQKIVNRYDFIHHFNSGINHVLCSDMSQNSMFLGVEISEFNTVSSLKQSKYFSSCIQNSKLATKAKVPHIVFKLINSREDIRSSREIESIQKSFFKAQPFQILQQKQFIENFLTRQRRIKNLDYIE